VARRGVPGEVEFDGLLGSDGRLELEVFQALEGAWEGEHLPPQADGPVHLD